MKHLVTFIGFGEAGSSIAGGLNRNGLTDLVAYDAMANDAKRGIIIRERAKQNHVTLAEDLEQACKGAAYILNFTSPSVALASAQSILPNLEEGQIYIDINSTSPTTMREIDQVERKAGVLFCDGAALGNVSKLGCSVPIAVCGKGAEQFKRDLTPYGTNITVLEAPIGGASAMKMLRSIVSKGMQQLMLEFTMCAKQYGILHEMMQIVNNKFKDITLEEYANEAFIRLVRHASRREAEANGIVETIEAVGLDASMSRATAYKFHNLAQLHLADRLNLEEDMGYEEVLDLIFHAMEAQTGSKG